MAELLGQEMFTKQLGTKFKVQVTPEQTIDLELVEVSDLKQSARQEQFTIVFRGPNESFLDQGIRRLDHGQIGSADIFLVPVRKDNAGFYYEAAFNRIREQA